jgi:hypothetical protein
MAKAEQLPNEQAAAWLMATWQSMMMNGYVKLIYLRGEPVGIEVHGARSLVPTAEELKPVQHSAEGERT